MATLEAWLGPGLFKVLGPYLEDELGAEGVDDLRMLEPQQLKAVRAMLKPLPLKKFNIRYNELMGGSASAALKRALSGLSVSLRIELAMRKRKRVADLDDLDEKEAETAAAAQRKRGAAELEDGTGSSTEWSEGFSSDDEAKRRARPPKKVRALARAARKLECAETEAGGSVAQDASLGSVDQTG